MSHSSLLVKEVTFSGLLLSGLCFQQVKTGVLGLKICVCLTQLWTSWLEVTHVCSTENMFVD